MLDGFALTDPLIIKVPGRPFSLNAERTKHWSDRADRTAQLRHDAKYCALEVMPSRPKPALFEQVRIIVEPWAIDRRYRQDVGACLPSAKAAIDGLVDAGVIADDDDSHLLELAFRPHQFGVDQIVLTVIEVEGGEAMTNTLDDVA